MPNWGFWGNLGLRGLRLTKLHQRCLPAHAAVPAMHVGMATPRPLPPVPHRQGTDLAEALDFELTVR